MCKHLGWEETLALLFFLIACIFFSKKQAKKIQASHSGLTLSATPASPFLASIPVHYACLILRPDGS